MYCTCSCTISTIRHILCMCHLPCSAYTKPITYTTPPYTAHTQHVLSVCGLTVLSCKYFIVWSQLHNKMAPCYCFCVGKGCSTCMCVLTVLCDCACSLCKTVTMYMNVYLYMCTSFIHLHVHTEHFFLSSYICCNS